MSDVVHESVAGGNATVLAKMAEHATHLWSPEVAFVRGDGALIYDADGREYIDCLAGIAVASVGHGNPRLAEAVATQARRLIVCPQNLGNDVRAEFLAELFTFVRPPLTRAFLSNSGSEANEAALKWARMATGRSRFVAAKRGFSGRTMGVLPLTWEPKYREPFVEGDSPAKFVTYGDEDELRAAVTDETAAVLLEPIQGESGIRPAGDAYLKLARKLTLERGALLILDEIQTGVGRTGTFFAHEPSGVDADVVTLAKGLAGGVPIGATLMTEAVSSAMPLGGHGTTFGGNPLASAAGLAVLREIRERGLMEHAQVVGERLSGGLRSLGDSRVVEVRGRGLLIGMELSVPAADLVTALMREGVVTTSGGSNTVRFLPPLVITAEQVDEVVARTGRALAAIT
ncbi:MAG TPA: aminotransferase class III-fold pyridoxal phosphate-dependent enzyme [Trueperaceae bacterium]|nr:aminotransferase class III-fold pyridoxal phosphate-dependent enzyme [Trueperaceae bacterium]